jgi:hypothetical protein
LLERKVSWSIQTLVVKDSSAEQLQQWFGTLYSAYAILTHKEVLELKSKERNT